ncbi:MAG: RNA polymerase sigma factor [Candidatus Sulfotelmatobacter sp.]
MDEVQLVLLAQAGDRKAFELLLGAVYPSLSRYIVGLVGNTEADDVMQDTAIQIHRKLRWLREPAYFRPWAYRTASRFAIAHLKKGKRWESFEDHVELADALTFPEDFEAKFLWNDQLQAMASEVSPASRAVFLLHYQHGNSLEEISAILEIPIGTVKSRLFYAVRTLRKKFPREDSYEQDPIR